MELFNPPIADEYRPVPLTEKARQLAADHLELAEQMAWWQYRQSARLVPLDELRGDAMYGLVYAAGMFDDTRNVPFPAYARMAIRHRLMQAVRNWLRGGSRRAKSFSEFGENAHAELDPACTRAREAGSEMNVDEMIGQVRRVLPARWFQAFHMYYGQGFTMREVGEQLGVTRERVRQLLDKAMLRARAHILPLRVTDQRELTSPSGTPSEN